jgi:hypothetical protein
MSSDVVPLTLGLLAQKLERENFVKTFHYYYYCLLKTDSFLNIVHCRVDIFFLYEIFSDFWRELYFVHLSNAVITCTLRKLKPLVVTHVRNSLQWRNVVYSEIRN